MNNPYCTKNEHARKLLDRPRWQEWIEFECNHLNSQIEEAGECKYDLAYFKPNALEWSYYQDEVTRGGHELVCLLVRMAEILPERHHRYLHRGLTSSNTIDTCNHRRWNELAARLVTEHSLLASAAQRWSLPYPVVGYTHGRRGYHTTTSQRNSILRPGAFDHMKTLPWSVSGGPMGYGTDHRQCVPRSDYWQMWAWVAQMVYSIEQLATDYRFYCSDLDVGVIGLMGQGVATTSSCMPGKVNPSAFERICSVGYMVRNQISMQLLQPPQWLDRDLVHSAMERATIDLIWDRAFWLVEEMNRLVSTTTLVRSREPAADNSYDKLNEYLDAGLGYAEARAKAIGHVTG
jgi:adenylosuccinate lyase